MNQIRSTIIAGVLALGTAAFAGAQSAQPAPQARAHVRAQGAQRAQRAGRGHPRFARQVQRQLFKGIKLSDAEKANVKAVREKYAAQNKALREQLKPQIQAAREARQKGDTAALKALWGKNGAAREQTRKLLESERNDLRAALTPANQATFDANLQRVEQRVAKRAARVKNNMKKDGRPGRVGKGPRA